MRHSTRVVIPLFGLWLCLAGTAGAEPSAPAQPLLVATQDQGVVCFRVELADDPEARRRGLMHRRELAADAGMLFDYRDEQRVQMWMKNTWIPLDMLFIDGRGRVVRIVTDTQPHSTAIIDSAAPVRAVLEINAGTVARFGIRPGDRVRHAIFGDAPVTNLCGRDRRGSIGTRGRPGPGMAPVARQTLQNPIVVVALQ